MQWACNERVCFNAGYWACGCSPCTLGSKLYNLKTITLQCQVPQTAFIGNSISLSTLSAVLEGAWQYNFSLTGLTVADLWTITDLEMTCCTDMI